MLYIKQRHKIKTSKIIVLKKNIESNINNNKNIKSNNNHYKQPICRLDKILQSHIGFRDLERLRTSPDYIQGLRKKLFAMIRQLGPPTFLLH